MSQLFYFENYYPEEIKTQERAVFTQHLKIKTKQLTETCRVVWRPHGGGRGVLPLKFNADRNTHTHPQGPEHFHTICERFAYIYE